MLMQLTDFFNSLPLRGVLAFFAALFLSLACGEKLIGFLHRHQAKGQPIREDGPQSHLLTKKGTPTMGGIAPIFAVILTTSLFALVLRRQNHEDLSPWLLTLLFALANASVGIIDDLTNI